MCKNIEDQRLTPAARGLLARAAALLDPGPVPARLADLINPRFHDRPNHEETGIED